MYIPQELIDQIQQNNDIVDVINEYIPLTKKGSNYVCLCPFHSDSNPSLTVSRHKQLFKCFACGEGGNVVTFIQKYESLSFPEALKSLANRARITLPEEYGSEYSKETQDYKQRLIDCNTEAARYYYALLRSSDGKNGYDYFKNRKLSDETMRKFGLGFAKIKGNDVILYLRSKGFSDKEIIDSGLGVYDERNGMKAKFWNRVMFPIKNQAGKVIGFGGRVMGDGEPKYLNSQETKVFNKSTNLYSFDIARQSRSGFFILCEGYMDVIALHQAGFSMAVASLGTAFTPGQANLIKRYVKDVYLSYDSDGPGVKAAVRAGKICREYGLSCKVIDMRPYKDPDEFIKNLGSEEYQKRIDSAKNVFLFEIEKLREQYDSNDPDANTRYVEEVAELLSDFKDEVTRTNYIKACAKEMGITVEALTGKVSEAAGKNRKFAHEDTKINAGKNKTEDKTLKPQQLLLTFLAEYPSVFKTIEKIVTPDDFTDETYRKVATIFYEDLRNNTASPARMVSLFEDPEEQNKVSDLFTCYLKGIEDKSEKETALVDIIYQIKNNSLEYLKQSGTVVNPNVYMAKKKELMEIRKIKINLP